MIDTIKPGYIRVTEVLNTYSKLEYVNPDVLNNAADRGTDVDLACKLLINGVEPFELDVHLENYVNSFREWMQGKEFIPNPGRMYCDELKITGECDGIYKSNQELVLFDIKTPENQSRSWPLQGAAYAYLARLQGIDIRRIIFVRLSKEGKSAKENEYDFEIHWDLFEKALQLHQYFYAKKRPSTPVIEGP